MTLIFNPYKTNQFSLINFILYFKTKHFNQIKKIEKILIQLKQSTFEYINISILVGFKNQ